MSKVQPIKPSDVISEKEKQMPDEVIEAFNELIAKNMSGHEAGVYQQEVIELILEKMQKAGKDVVRSHIYDNHWLEVEDIYRKVGWKVHYDSPSMGDSYPAVFTFTRSRRHAV